MRRAALPVTFTDLPHHVATAVPITRSDRRFGKCLRPQRHDVVGRLADLPVAPGGPVTKQGLPLVKPTRPFIASSHIVPHLRVEGGFLNLIAVAGLLCGQSQPFDTARLMTCSRCPEPLPLTTGTPNARRRKAEMPE